MRKLYINSLIITLVIFSTSTIHFSNGIDSLKKELNNSIVDTNSIKILNDISWKYLTNNLDSSFYFIRKAVQLAESKNYPRWLAKSYNTLGVAYWYRGLLDSALTEIKKSYAINKIFGNVRDISKNLGNIGMLYDNLGKTDSSIYYYEKALGYFEVNNDKIGMAKIFANLALIQTDLKKYDIAIEQNDRAIKLYNEADYLEDIPRVLANKGLIYINLEQFEKALEIFDNGLEIAESQNNLSVKAKIFEYIGSTNKRTGKTSEAIVNIEKALGIHKELGEKISIANNLLELSNLLVYENNYNLTEFYLNECSSLSIENKHVLKRLYNNYKILYTLKKDYKNAYLYFEKFTELKESLLNEDYNLKLADFQVKYETREKEIELQKKNAQLQNEEKLNKFYLLLLIIGSLGSITIGGLYTKKRSAYLKLVEKNNHIFNKCKNSAKKKETELNETQNNIYSVFTNYLENLTSYGKTDLTLDAIAKEIGTNRSTLSEIVNIINPNGFSTLINMYKINAAIKLMDLHPNWDIKSISIDAGFKSYSTFSEAFYKHTGIKPSFYRKNKDKTYDRL
ncbi:MAG: tetratricopeptide repeat protein [Melioribacteraceae bacterium]|nr:tetratricopeptide repeat protein [Melioribacteraceae bacterium]